MSSIPKDWTPAATADIAKMTPAEFGGTDPKVFHEQKVQQYYDNHKTGSLKTAVKAKIRYAPLYKHCLLLSS